MLSLAFLNRFIPYMALISILLLGWLYTGHLKNELQTAHKTQTLLSRQVTTLENINRENVAQIAELLIEQKRYSLSFALLQNASRRQHKQTDRIFDNIDQDQNRLNFNGKVAPVLSQTLRDLALDQGEHFSLPNS